MWEKKRPFSSIVYGVLLVLSLIVINFIFPDQFHMFSERVQSLAKVGLGYLREMRTEKDNSYILSEEAFSIEEAGRTIDLYQMIQQSIRDGNLTFTIDNQDKDVAADSVIEEIRQAIEGTYLAAIIESYEVTVHKTMRRDKVIKSSSEVMLFLRHTLNQEAEVQAWAEETARELTGSDREKVTQLYERIIRMTVYDAGDDQARYDGISVHSPYSIVKNGRGVCQAYASLFQITCDKAGIPCRYRIGTATRSDGVTESHAWNLVQVEGLWWGLDATWGDPVFSDGSTNPDYVNYGYLLTDLSSTHKPDSKIE